MRQVTEGARLRPQLTEHALLKLRKLDRLLDRAYGAPETDLDNKPDPLDEAVYIILSFQTDIARTRHIWTELRSVFPTWEDLDKAPVRNVARVLHAGGLHDQKARTIKRLLNAVKQRAGHLYLDLLREMDDQEAESFLTRLPGLSWKGARCVLLYSLDRAVFPVDGNTFRILQRVGVLPPNSVYRRRGLHDALQLAVPAARRKPFHVNLVVHGQRTCLSRRPRCHECAAWSICEMRNLPTSKTAEETADGRDLWVRNPGREPKRVVS